jgi:hypothetical protein
MDIGKITRSVGKRGVYNLAKIVNILRKLHFDPRYFKVFQNSSGIEITLRNKKDEEYHWKCEITKSDASAGGTGATITVHGGIYKRYSNNQVYIPTAPGGEHYDDTWDLTGIKASKYVYIELDDPLKPTTATIQTSDTYPVDDGNYYKKHVLGFAEKVGDTLTWEQYWSGGDITSDGVTPDSHLSDSPGECCTTEYQNTSSSSHPNEGVLQLYDTSNSASAGYTYILREHYGVNNVPEKGLWVPTRSTNSCPRTCGTDPSEPYDTSLLANIDNINIVGLSRADHRHFISNCVSATYAITAGTANNCTAQTHALLFDVQNDTWSDDHHSTNDPVAGQKIAYVAVRGTPARNDFQSGSGLGDLNGAMSIDVANRKLHRDNQMYTVDWYICQSFDLTSSPSQGRKSADWALRVLYDSGVNDVVNWDAVSTNWHLHWSNTNSWDKSMFKVDVTGVVNILSDDAITIESGSNASSWTTDADLTFKPVTDKYDHFTIGTTDKLFDDIQLAAYNRVNLRGGGNANLYLGGYVGATDNFSNIYYNGNVGASGTITYLDSGSNVHSFTVTNGAITGIS